MNNVDRILELIRQMANEDCKIVNIYFQGFDNVDDLKPKYNYSFHREPVNMERYTVKEEGQ